MSDQDLNVINSDELQKAISNLNRHHKYILEKFASLPSIENRLNAFYVEGLIDGLDRLSCFLYGDTGHEKLISCMSDWLDHKENDFIQMQEDNKSQGSR